MSKFKIGDRVRRIVGDNKSTPVGFEGVIRAVHQDLDDEWEYRFDNHAWGYAEAYGAKWEMVEDTGPVRAVTRKEIVNGVYGRISIAKQVADEPRLLIALANLGGGTEGVHHGWSLDELKDVISTLTAIRDALEGGVS